MTFADYNQAIDFVKKADFISFDDSFGLSKLCSAFLGDRENETKGRDLVIRVLDSKNKVEPSTFSIWNDLVESAGLYPYVEPKLLSGGGLVRYEYHKSPHLPSVHFHQEQLTISLHLLGKNSVILSAPTSFGKSLLIEEVIASEKYSNVVIIQPTLALLDETRKKLKKYTEHYKIVVSTSQRPSENKANIFLFTGERVVEYQHFPKIDFFVVDEFYKLSLGRDDDRAITLNQAFYKLLKKTKKFYLLGPMIKSIPQTFHNQFDFLWYHTTYSTVSIDVIPIYPERRYKWDKDEKEVALFSLLDTLDQPTLVYCSSPAKASSLTLNYIRHLADNSRFLGKGQERNKAVIDWIKENTHPNWILIRALENSIAFHHGALPRHLGSSIVDAFNDGSVNFLFCTATLIEGVNTTAKNVVLFDKLKGKKQIDYFDYRNISGRSGRMSKYFIGTVYRFEDEPLQLELEIDIPIITQENAPAELLIQIDESELSEESKRKLEKFNKLDEELKGIIKLNAGMPLDGQIKIVNEIESNLSYYHNLLNWSRIPKYNQLSTVVELAWNNLLKKGENKGGMKTAKQLAFMAFRYFELKSISALIRVTASDPYHLKTYEDEEERINIAVYTVLNTLRHWFEYKLPKLLGTVSNLQEYVFSKHNLPAGNYGFFAGQIEHGFLPANLAALLEYDIPISAIRKLAGRIRANADVDEIVDILRSTNLGELDLGSYELTKFKAIL